MVNARRAWVFQIRRSWYVGWYEADGQRKKKSVGPKKKDANEFYAIKSAELIQGISQGYRAFEWSKFVAVRGPQDRKIEFAVSLGDFHRANA